MRGGGAAREAGGRRATAVHAACRGGLDCRLGARHGEERTLNMEPMFVTLEVSKLSGWLNADAPCRESKEGIRCEVRPRGAGGRLAVAVHAQGAGEGKAEARVLWRAAPGCIGYHRCAHPLLGFLDEHACLDDLLIFFAAAGA